MGVFNSIHATIKEPRCDCRATDTDVIGVRFQACHRNKCAGNDTDVIGVSFRHVI